MFGTAIFLVVVALIALAASYTVIPARDYQERPLSARRYTRFAVYVVFGLAAICLLFASLVFVGTKQVGIITTFGRPGGEVGAGPHLIWPWQDINEMDGAIQLQSFEGESYDKPGTSVKVRLGNNSSAFIEANINWRLKPEAAPRMFQDYRTFNNIRENLVDKQLQVALSHRFAGFNPQQQTQGADLPGIAEQVKNDLQAAVGNDIEIISVKVPGLFYDSGTQQRIDAFNQEAQQTKNAEQAVQTAKQQREAAEQRAAQAKPDLTVAVFTCVMEAAKAGRDAAGCWGQIGVAPTVTMPVPGR